MTEYVSSGSRIAFGRETTFGTKATTDRFLGITHAGQSLPDKQVEVKQYRSFGTGRRWYKNVAGRRTRPGTLDFLPTTGELFYYAFGTEVFNDNGNPAAAPNDHTLTPANSANLPSMSLGVALEGNPDFLRTYTGVSVNSMNVSLTEAGELTTSMDILAKNVEDDDTASPTLFTQPTDDEAATSQPCPYMFYDRAANVTFMGDTIARVKGFNWSIQNNLKAMYFSQSSNAQDPFTFLTSYPDFELTIDIVPAGKISGDTDALYYFLENETIGDITIPFQRDTNDTLAFTFDDCAITTAPHNLPEDGGEVTVSVTLRPETVQVDVTDQLTAYASM